MIIDNFNGFLINKNDNVECLNKLYKLIEEPELRKYLGFNANKTFLEKFEENTMGEKIDILLSYPPCIN
jgi:hypothetical protein